MTDEIPQHAGKHTEGAMIAQILSRSFLLPWLEPVQDQLAELITDEGDPSGELTAALDAIGEVLESGIPGQPDDSDDSTTRQGAAGTMNRR